MPVAERLPDAPAAWDAFFTRALAPDRAGRPASAAAFLQGLEGALGTRLRSRQLASGAGLR